MARNEQSFIQIYSNDIFDIYYDKDTKRYHIDVFDDGHYWDEVWFDEYKEEDASQATDKEIFKEDALNDRVKKFECSVEDFKRLGYTDEEAEDIFKHVNIYI